ncbi:MAG TPA: DUF1667 domain-containing protein [Sediminispirochaeta sp.]|nr:DUF1667 domain-containing protein [Sediminispirochaeta sp.]
MAEKTATKDMVCIVCPIGCRLKVSQTGEEVRVEGNRCPRGEVYGREEILAPKRTVTATCTVISGRHRRLPVKTDAALPTEHIDSLLQEIYRLKIEAPVEAGQVLLENFKDTGVNLVAGRRIPN